MSVEADTDTGADAKEGLQVGAGQAGPGPGPPRAWGTLLEGSGLDFCAVGLLLLCAAILLLPLRIAVHTSSPLPKLVGLVWLAIVVLWAWRAGSLRVHWSGAGASLSLGPQARRKVLTGSAVVLLLAGFVALAFWEPMSRAFWQGADDATDLWAALQGGRSLQGDLGQDRPFFVPVSLIGLWLRPDSVIGILGVVVLLELLTALSLAYLLWTLFPRAPWIGAAAALLFVVAPVDALRFDVIAIEDYYFALALLLAAAALYLASYARCSRLLLAVSCVCLGVSLLTLETGYTLAPLAVGLLFAHGWRPHRRPWLLAWLGTIGILGLRFLLFLLVSPTAYQLSAVVQQAPTATAAVANLGQHVSATLTFLQVVPEIADAWQGGLAGTALLVTACALGLLWVLRPTLNRQPSVRRLAVGLVVSAAAIVLAVLPYTSIIGSTRTEIFAAPAQAAFWVLAIALGMRCLPFPLPQPVRFALPTLCVLALCLGAVMHAFRQQDLRAQQDPRFDKLVSIYQQLAQQAPHVAPGTAYLFLVPPGPVMPLGTVNYGVSTLTEITLGVPGYPANHPQNGRPTVRCDGGGCLLSDLVPPRWVQYPYSRLIVWSIDGFGQATLITTFPPTLLPAGVEATGYDPSALITPGAPVTLPFLEPLPWMTPYAVPQNQVALGAGWYQPETSNGERFVWGQDGAELDLSPSNQDEIVLDVEPGPSAASLPAELTITDLDGTVVRSARLAGRTYVPVDAVAGEPLPHALVLHLAGAKPVPNDPRTLDFRLFSPP